LAYRINDLTYKFVNPFPHVYEISTKNNGEIDCCRMTLRWHDFLNVLVLLTLTHLYGNRKYKSNEGTKLLVYLPETTDRNEA
jgi:hypothetical protein